MGPVRHYVLFLIHVVYIDQTRHAYERVFYYSQTSVRIWLWDALSFGPSNEGIAGSGMD